MSADFQPPEHIFAMGEGGAVGKGKEDDLENAYELLELEEDAGEKEIKAKG